MQRIMTLHPGFNLALAAGQTRRGVQLRGFAGVWCDISLRRDHALLKGHIRMCPRPWCGGQEEWGGVLSRAGNEGGMR